MENNNTSELEIQEFVEATKTLLKQQNLQEGDYCVLLTEDDVTIRAYKSLDRFQERVIEDIKQLPVDKINWAICTFD